MIRVRTYLLDNMSQTLTGTQKGEWETWTKRKTRKEQSQPRESLAVASRALGSRMGFKGNTPITGQITSTGTWKLRSNRGKEGQQRKIRSGNKVRPLV